MVSDELRKAGNHDKARAKLIEATEVTTEMAYSFIEKCKVNNIKFIVAPFEADAQLAYLNVMNIVDFVISEDSDILVYGAKSVFYKMKQDGVGDEVCLKDILQKPESGFYELDFDEFVQACILSGCDYSKSVKKVGINKAVQFIKEMKTFKRVKC